jgi:hypothetical protein
MSTSEEEKNRQELDRKIQQQERERQIRREEELRKIREQQINEKKQHDEEVRGKPSGTRPTKDK